MNDIPAGTIIILKTDAGKRLFQKMRPLVVIGRVTQWGYLLAPLSTKWDVMGENILIEPDRYNGLKHTSYIHPHWTCTVAASYVFRSIGYIGDRTLEQATESIAALHAKALGVEILERQA